MMMRRGSLTGNRSGHDGWHIPQDAHRHVGCVMAQDAHKPAGRTQARRTHTSPQDAHKGRPYYGRGWFCLHVVRVKPTWAGLPGWGGWMHVATRPRSMSPPSTRTSVAFTRKMSPRTQPPSIVGTLLVRVLPTCPRPANVPASCHRARVLPPCPRPACHGRALVVFARGSRKSDVGLPAWAG